MSGYQQADREAAAKLVERVSPMLLRFLAGPLQTRAYAEDMLQECWLRIHRSRHTYRPGTPVLPWFFAIARYTRIDAYRRRRQIDANELAVDDLSTSGAGQSTLPDAADRDLWRLVGQLPPSQQEVIQMLKVSGLSLEEVARATGSSVGSVKQKAHRAYQKLRELLNLDNAARKSA
jgi:RNA polymerase sigma-70 factor (ECF subfamily)